MMDRRDFLLGLGGAAVAGLSLSDQAEAASLGLAIPTSARVTGMTQFKVGRVRLLAGRSAEVSSDSADIKAMPSGTISAVWTQRAGSSSKLTISSGIFDADLNAVRNNSPIYNTEDLQPCRVLQYSNTLVGLFFYRGSVPKYTLYKDGHLVDGFPKTFDADSILYYGDPSPFVNVLPLRGNRFLTGKDLDGVTVYRSDFSIYNQLKGLKSKFLKKNETLLQYRLFINSRKEIFICTALLKYSPWEERVSRYMVLTAEGLVLEQSEVALDFSSFSALVPLASERRFAGIRAEASDSDLSLKGVVFAKDGQMFDLATLQFPTLAYSAIAYQSLSGGACVAAFADITDSGLTRLWAGAWAADGTVAVAPQVLVTSWQLIASVSLAETADGGFAVGLVLEPPVADGPYAHRQTALIKVALA